MRTVKERIKTLLSSGRAAYEASKHKIKFKLLSGIVILCLLILVSSLFSLYYFKKIHKGFSHIAMHIFPASQKITDLADGLRESKNWAVRYTLEEDPAKLEQWKANYQKSFSKAQALFKDMAGISEKKIRDELHQVQKSLDVFSKEVTPVLEQHEERLALAQFKREKIGEFSSIASEIDSELGDLSQGVITRQDLHKKVTNLKKIVADSAVLFSQSIFSALKVQSEAELEDALASKKAVFEENMNLFDKEVGILFPLIVPAAQKQHLHKAKVLSVQMRRLVFGHQQLFDLYKTEVQKLVSIWKTIDALNSAYEEVHKGTESVVQLVNESMKQAMQTLSQSQQQNRSTLFFLIFIFVILGIGASVFVSNSIISPIELLAGVTKEIGAGDLRQRVPVSSSDEMGELAIAFNQMTESLEKANAEIQELNKGLEKKVEERTKELRLTLEDLQLKNEQLVVGSRMKSEFLANMSHELRTPLNSIIGFSELIIADTSQKLSDRTKKNIQNVVDSGKDLLALINAILDIAKIEAGKMTVSCSEFNIADLIESSIMTNEVLLRGKDVKIEKHLPKHVPNCYSDATKIKQIMNNLINNAVKFTEKGMISLSLEAKEKYFVFKVTDTGIGISQANQKIIFDEFRQVDASTTRKHGGSGLGLAIVKKMTMLLGGSVDVESEEGKWSTFAVIFPIRFEAKKEEMPKREKKFEREARLKKAA
ncbi:MAG: ATP-binding protein [Deltaproteobacteria bacterium]